MIFNTLNKLEKLKEYAPVPIRIIFLLYFILAVKAQVYLPSNAEKFGENLAVMGIPFASFMGYIATYSLFIAHLMIVIGFKVRLAAIPEIIYFLVAVFVYHVPEGHGISQTMPASVMLAMSIFLLLNGAGKPSVDEWKKSRS